MGLHVDCPRCKKRYKVPDNAAGKTVRCPTCQGKLQVPPAGTETPSTPSLAGAVPPIPPEGAAYPAAPPPPLPYPGQTFPTLPYPGQTFGGQPVFPVQPIYPAQSQPGSLLPPSEFFDSLAQLDPNAPTGPTVPPVHGGGLLWRLFPGPEGEAIRRVLSRMASRAVVCCVALILLIQSIAMLPADDWVSVAVGAAQAIWGLILVGVGLLPKSEEVNEKLTRTFTWTLVVLSLIPYTINLAVMCFAGRFDTVFYRFLIINTVILAVSLGIVALLATLMKHLGCVNVLGVAYVISTIVMMFCATRLFVVGTTVVQSLSRPSGEERTVAGGPAPSPHSGGTGVPVAAGAAPGTAAAVAPEPKPAAANSAPGVRSPEGATTDVPSTDEKSAAAKVAASDVKMRPLTVPVRSGQRALTLAAEQAWKASPDPAPPPSSGFPSAPIRLVGQGEVRRAILSRPDAGRAVVLRMERPATTASPVERRRAVSMRVAKSAAPDVDKMDKCPTGDLYSLEGYDLATGKQFGRVGLPGPCELVEVSPSGQLALVRTGAARLDVWSLAERKHVCGMQPYQGRAEVVWATFADNDALLTLSENPRQLVLWKLPECRAVYYLNAGDDAAAALSRSGRQIVLLEGTGLRILDTRSGDLLGNLPGPPDAPVRAWASGGAAFSPDGSRLALLASEGPRLLEWDLKTGQLVSDLKPGVEEGELEWCGPRQVLVATKLGQVSLVDLERKTVAGRFQIAGGQRAIHALDARPWGVVQIHATAPAFLACLGEASRLATSSAGPGVTEATLDLDQHLGLNSQQLLREEVRERVSARARGDEVLKREEQDGREYFREILVDMIAAPDTDVRTCARWLPCPGRPVVGVRWGVGVQLASPLEGPPIRTMEELAQVMGPIVPELGLQLVRAGQSRMFGDWPSNGIEHLRPLVFFVGTGSEEELIAAAQRRALDLLLVASSSARTTGRAKPPAGAPKLRVMEVGTQKPLWSSEGIPGANSVVFLREVLKHIDARFRLDVVPLLNSAQIAGRLKEIDSPDLPPDYALSALLEIRYYQAARLLTPEEAVTYYDTILGSGKGKELVNPIEAQRVQALQAWLKQKTPEADAAAGKAAGP